MEDLTGKSFGKLTVVNGFCRFQSVKIIVLILMIRCSAQGIIYYGCGVFYTQYISNQIITVGVIHYLSASAVAYLQLLQAAHCWVIIVMCFGIVSVFQILALFEDIIRQLFDIIVGVSFFFALHALQIPCTIVGVIDYFAIRVGHFLDAVPSVVFKFRNVGLHIRWRNA